MLHIWPLVGDFTNRSAELRQLDRWWMDPESAMPLAVYGRRRVGKSWLLRRFADGKPAHVLVSRQINPGSQLSEFARALAPQLGVVPDLPDLPSLFRVLYRTASSRKRLIVIDEFPWLLPTGELARTQVLSSVQAVMEDERERSQLKVILCGSLVGQMESLLSERAPLRGRLTGLMMSPLQFHEAREYLPDMSALDAFQHYAVAGGMPYYLSLLGKHDLRRAICAQVLNRMCSSAARYFDSGDDGTWVTLASSRWSLSPRASACRTVKYVLASPVPDRERLAARPTAAQGA